MSDKRTCLYEQHLNLNAKMVSFGGFEMPLQYTDIVDEHNAVRHHCGVFDVSHMGEVLVTGADAEAFVQFIFTNDISGATNGKIYYGMMLHENGGTIDDLLVYKTGTSEYLLVVNAANIDKDVCWIREQAPKFNVVVENQSDDYGQLAIQGPEAESYVESILGIPCKDMAFYTCKKVTKDGEKLIVSRTGYTGEDGFEIYGSKDYTKSAWSLLMESGVVKPCGLGCRDTLRFEVGLPLYGDELTDDITPLEAGLGMFVKLDKTAEFIGKAALIQQKKNGLTRKLVGIELQDRAIPRHGYEVESEDGRVVGVVTTGYNTPSTGKSVCFAMVDFEVCSLGTPLYIRIHRKLHPGIVTKKRFYNKNYKK